MWVNTDYILEVIALTAQKWTITSQHWTEQFKPYRVWKRSNGEISTCNCCYLS